MRLADLPVTDVRDALIEHRAGLLALLETLTPDQWAAPTAAPGWAVKDVAAHLLDVDLSWLSRQRDHDASGLVEASADHATFVAGLARRNQRWVDGATVLSPRLLVDLLRWSGQQLTGFLASLDLRASSSVYWAGPAPLWFDLAREFTERWVHGRQIREACTSDTDASADPHLGLVIRTFVWAFPHQYRPAAPPGTGVTVRIDPVGSWTLTRVGDAWTLAEGLRPGAAATLTLTADTAWRLLTGARYDPSDIRTIGAPGLLEPLFGVRGVIV
jgi:uncharacterized protein (TIGR03083 family)